MASKPRKRIAVVGGGIAGIGAAWSLSRKFDVSLFEQSDYLGGNARSIPVRSTCVDAGFQIFNEWLYPNFTAMLRRFDVEMSPITDGRFTYSLNFGDGCISTAHVTDSLKHFLVEAARFESEVPDIVVDSEAYVGVTAAEYFEKNGYSKQFLYRCLIPQLSILFVTPKKLDEIPIQLVARVFGPASLISFQDSPAYRIVMRGSQHYVEKLFGDTNAEFRLNTPVASITRSQGSVNVLTGEGQGEEFDEVVIATDADSALRLLADATDEERMLLGAFEYDPVSVSVHTDDVVMPSDRRLWGGYTFVTDEVTGPFKNSIRTYFAPMIQRWIDFDLFVSFNVPDGRLDPEKVVAQFDWKHLVMDRSQILSSAELHRIQGKRKTWFCGEYTSVAFGHEYSFVSGLIVATALGANYPFEDSTLARLAFYDHATYHMKLLPAREPDPGCRYQLLTETARIKADVVGREFRKEVSSELKRRVPRWLYRILFSAGIVERCVVGLIAKRMSALEAYNRSRRS